MQFWKLYKLPLLLTAVSFILYWLFAYDVIRTDYTKLIFYYGLLWLAFILVVKLAKDHTTFLTIVAFLSRAIFILSIPNLSQDFYRFIWDGRMILEGFNPYVFTPESFINTQQFPVAQAKELYAGMGQLNASHYTNYPPLNQLCFVIAGLFSSSSILGSVVGMRMLIIAADFGTLVFGKRLLSTLNIPVKNIFWYILNPFIIIELTGNLHFEGVMIFFLVWSLYLLHSGHRKWAAVVFALSISVKLIPLLFLPLFFWYFKKLDVISGTVDKSKRPLDCAQGDNSKLILDQNQSKPHSILKLLSFYGIVGITTLILFAPFYSSKFITNYAQTVGLWFQSFEFNASIYYVAREIGYLFRGYNEIAIIGKVLPILVFLFVIGLGLYKRQISTKTLITHMLYAFSFYLFLSTTVHPWYLATLLILSIFTNYRFPLVWSFVVIFSYLAYVQLNNAEKSENLWIIAFEYLLVYSVLIWEVFLKKNQFIPFSENKKT